MRLSKFMDRESFEILFPSTLTVAGGEDAPKATIYLGEIHSLPHGSRRWKVFLAMPLRVTVEQDINSPSALSGPPYWVIEYDLVRRNVRAPDKIHRLWTLERQTSWGQLSRGVTSE